MIMITNRPPISFVAEYDKAIRALEFCNEDSDLELSLEEVEQYVNDDWHWKNQFIGSTARYKG